MDGKWLSVITSFMTLYDVQARRALGRQKKVRITMKRTSVQEQTRSLPGTYEHINILKVSEQGWLAVELSPGRSEKIELSKILAIEETQ